MPARTNDNEPLTGHIVTTLSNAISELRLVAEEDNVAEIKTRVAGVEEALKELLEAAKKAVKPPRLGL